MPVVRRPRAPRPVQGAGLPVFDHTNGRWPEDWDPEAERLLTVLAGYYDAPEVPGEAVAAMLDAVALQIMYHHHAQVSRLLGVLSGSRLPLALALPLLAATQPRADQLPARSALLLAVTRRCDAPGDLARVMALTGPPLTPEPSLETPDAEIQEDPHD